MIDSIVPVIPCRVFTQPSAVGHHARSRLNSLLNDLADIFASDALDRKRANVSVALKHRNHRLLIGLHGHARYVGILPPLLRPEFLIAAKESFVHLDDSL